MGDTALSAKEMWLVAPIPVLTTSLPCTHTGGDGSLVWSLLGVLSQVVVTVPKHPMPKAHLGPPSLGRDEDGDRQGSCAISCHGLSSYHCKKIPVPGRCHFPANMWQASCVREGDKCAASVL